MFRGSCSPASFCRSGTSGGLSSSVAPSRMSLSFPPVLDRYRWVGSTGSKHYPGSSNTWKKALRARPLHYEPSRATVRDLQMCAGGRFDLLQDAVQLPAEAIPKGRDPMYDTSAQYGSGGGSRPLYDTVWKGATQPSFNVFDYTRKHGRAPAPKNLTAPQGINDLSAWFAEYGKPKVPPSGVLSEFTPTLQSIPRGNGELSSSVRMYRGSVLR